MRFSKELRWAVEDLVSEMAKYYGLSQKEAQEEVAGALNNRLAQNEILDVIHFSLFGRGIDEEAV